MGNKKFRAQDGDWLLGSLFIYILMAPLGAALIANPDGATRITGVVLLTWWWWPSWVRVSRRAFKSPQP